MIPAERAHVHVAALTHPGMSGKNNEDRFAVTALRIEGETPLPVVFAVISDGIGGHRAGEVAAETAVETITQALARSDGTHPLETLRQAVQGAGASILAQAQEDESKHGMGATCVCALIINDRLFIASVGDSRIYLLRGDKLRQLTIDHTWIQEAIDAGILTPEQSRNHPNAHVIRRYLGSAQPVEPDLRLRLAAGETKEQMLANQGLPLEACDQVLLCSDGLTDLVSNDEISTMLREHEQGTALQKLTDLANERGGHDNITIVALQYPSSVLETAPTIPAVRPRPKVSIAWTSCLTGLIAVILLAAAALGGYLFLNGTVLLGKDSTPTATLTRTAGTPTPTVTLTTPPGSITPTQRPAQTGAAEPSQTPRIITTLAATAAPAATYTAWPTNIPTP